MSRRVSSLAGIGAVAILVAAAPAVGQTPPEADYWVYVANESSDIVSRVRFGPEGITEEKKIRVGIMPADLDGAHGLSVSRDGRHWYLSLAHGNPYGQVWKFTTGSDRLLDSATVGLFPATMGITPDGGTLFASNFNLHGNHVPSSVSVIFTPAMQELARVTTCVMPHGGRVNRAGTAHYSACMMSDQLVEISTRDFAVARRLLLTREKEQLLSSETLGAMPMGEGICKPTWVAVSANDRSLYVPCNGRGEVLEIDAATLEITRRFATGKGPYNADASPDGKFLVVSLKGDQAVAVFDLATGRETRVATSQSVTHGVVVTPDSRYAFVSNEAVGRTRGTVDVIDLETKQRVASVEVQHQPGGIGFWKMEPRD